MLTLTIDMPSSAQILGTKPEALRSFLAHENMAGVLKFGSQWRLSIFTLAQLLNTTPQILLELIEDDIYVDIPVIGRCFVMNTKTKIIEEIKYPTEGAKSWLYTVDQVTSTNYLVAFKGDSQFSIFHVNKKSKKLTWLKDLTNFYDLIWNDRALTKQQEANETCYSFKPIY